MFLKIVGARSAEQSGIKGVKKPFDPNIIESNMVEMGTAGRLAVLFVL